MYFSFPFSLCNRETHFGRCPILLSPQSNTKHSVDLPCTHDIPLNTKHSIDLYHALTPMSCDVPVHMKCKMPLHVISFHMHNECYMDNTIHTTYRCHGQSHHLHMTSINHFIHINLSCKHISTFTFNMSFYDQAMTHTSKPCNGHCT